MSASTEPVIIAARGQARRWSRLFGERYQQVNSGLNPAGSYSLRPGVNFLLYVRRDLIPGGHWTPPSPIGRGPLLVGIDQKI